MTVDWTKPIETIDGYPARVISTDYRDGCLTLVVVQAECGIGSAILRFLKDGTKMYHGTAIRNRKVKKEGWVNLYHTPYAPVKYYCGGTVYDTEKTAKDNIQRGHDTYATTIKIEWEE